MIRSWCTCWYHAVTCNRRTVVARGAMCFIQDQTHNWRCIVSSKNDGLGLPNVNVLLGGIFPVKTAMSCIEMPMTLIHNTYTCCCTDDSIVAKKGTCQLGTSDDNCTRPWPQSKSTCLGQSATKRAYEPLWCKCQLDTVVWKILLFTHHCSVWKEPIACHFGIK